MPLSPNAPDYVSQVRGVLNDLREDYIKKQQLFQQDQQAQAQLGLGYAQLSAQRENQARQAALDDKKLQLQGLQNQRELENLIHTRSRQEAADRLERQKFDLLQQEKDQKMQEIDNKKREEAESGRLYSNYLNARMSGDDEKLIQAQQELDNSTLSGLIKSQLMDNADKSMERKRQIDEHIANQQKRPQANALIVRAANLPLDRITNEDASAALNDLETEFSQLGITDDTAKQFATVMSQKNALLAKLAQDDERAGISRLNADGMHGGVLTPAQQEKYDTIVKKYPDYKARVADPDSASYQELKGLAASINKEEAQNYLNDTKTRFMLNQKNLVEKNPALGVETIDPVTGEKKVTFALSMPNMNLTNRDIDPRTGTLLKAKQKEINDYEQVLNRALAGDVNPLQMLLGRTISSAPANPNIKKLQFMPNNPWDTAASTGGVPAGTPGTAVVPAIVPQRPTRPSDEQIIAMGSDPKTADQLIPGSTKTYRQAAQFLKGQLKTSQDKTVANPNSY